MDRAVYYCGYSKRFGWTLDEVDDAPVLIAERMLTVAAVEEEVAAERQRASAKQ